MASFMTCAMKTRFLNTFKSNTIISRLKEIKPIMIDYLNKYSIAAVIIWPLMYLFTSYFVKIVVKKFVETPNEILYKLCESIEQNNYINCVRILGKHPEYINMFNNNGYTPFLMASANGNTQIVKLMLKKGMFG